MRRLTASALIVALAATLTACFFAPAPIPSRSPDTSGVAGDLLPYYGQQLTWTRCENDRFDCATVTAPRDWDDPSAGDLQLAVIRQRAASADRVGSLLTNPGGPGASGYDFVRDASSQLVPAAVAEHYDVIGFDPRGVGRSSPVHCEDAAGTDALLYGITPGTRGSQEWEDALTEEAETYADACEANSDGLLPYISTVAAAKDMDLLRGVLGDQTLNYLGYSWGTALGARYADLFPQRVGRMVLDGAMDPSVPGALVGAEQAVGFQQTLEAFFTDCGQRDDCPYAGSLDDKLSDLSALLARVDRRPLDAADGRQVGADTVLTGIISTLYSPGSWSWLRQGLAEAEDGDPAAILAAADAYNGRVDGEYPTNTNDAFQAYNCMDYPVDPPAVQQEAQDRVNAAAPTVAPYWFGVDVCTSWPVPPTGVRGPVSAGGAPPIVVIGTTGDPATPYAWAQSLAQQLTSGVLITRVGEGHTGYNQGNPCVDDAVDAYLIDGTAPQADLRCG